MSKHTYTLRLMDEAALLLGNPLVELHLDEDGIGYIDFKGRVPNNIEGLALLVADASITSAKLAAAVAGDGLIGGAGSALAVNPDGSTLEINADAVRIKAAGVLSSHLANPQVYDPGRVAIAELRVASAVQDTETVTIGADVYEVDTHDVSTITGGRIRLNLSGGGTRKSQGTITFTLNPSNNDTIVLNGKTYTFQTTLTNVDGNVAIGVDLATSILNLQAAIALGAGAGTAYAAATTLHPTIGVASVTATTIVPQAKAGGTAGNALTMSSGQANAVCNGATLGTTQAGVDPTAAEFTTSLEAAINASATELVRATRVTANNVLINAATVAGGATPKVGAIVLATTETLGGANNAWDSATMRGGRAAAVRKRVWQSRVPLAVEDALNIMHFVFDFTPTTVRVYVALTATPALPVLFDGAVAIAGGVVTITDNGAVNLTTSMTVWVEAED